MITFLWHRKPQGVRAKLLKYAIKQTLKLAQVKLEKTELSIFFTDDITMIDLNKTYRQKNETTDVLSFTYKEKPPYIDLSGEIIISLDTAKKQAKNRGKMLEDELGELLIHGLLHILGYEDESVEGYEKMLKEGEKLWEKAKELYLLPSNTP